MLNIIVHVRTFPFLNAISHLLECFFFRQEGSEEWFVLGDESTEGIGTEVPLENEEMTKADISDSSVKPKGEHITLVGTLYYDD